MDSYDTSCSQCDKRYEFSSLSHMIREFEGLRLKSYDDSVGKRTIGYGFNLDRSDAKVIISSYKLNFQNVYEGITSIPKWVADDLLQKEIDTSKALLYNSGKLYADLPKCMLWVLIDMTYCLRNKFLKSFPKFWANLSKARSGAGSCTYDDVIEEMEDSLWFTQTGRRSKKLINMIIGCANCETTCGKYPV